MSFPFNNVPKKMFISSLSSDLCVIVSYILHTLFKCKRYAVIQQYEYDDDNGCFS